MAPLVRRSWAPCGKTPILYQRTRSHEKVSMIAALSVPPVRKRVGLHFALHARNINTKLIIRFLRNLSRQIKGPIILVWDRLQAHRAKKTSAFINSTNRMLAYFLPPYAPELNPTEFLWCYLKRNPLANRPFYTVKELSTTARYESSKIETKLLRSFLYATPLFLSKI